MDDYIKVRGKFVFPVYYGDGFCVYKYKDIDAGGQIILTGHELPCNKKITYEFSCKEVERKRFGKQLEVVKYTECVEKGKDAIIEYLASGLFKGIGKKTAEGIYATFGDNTLDILNNNPEEIVKAKGFGKKRAEAFIKAYKTSHAQAELFEYLAPFGFSPNAIQKIVKRFPDDTVSHVKENPYCLCGLRGVSFIMADKVAEAEGIKKDNYLRINAAAVQVLRANFLEGDAFMEIEDFARAFIRLCNCPEVTMKNWFSHIYGPISLDPTTGRYSRIKTIKEPRGINPYAGPIQSGLIKRVKTAQHDAIYPISAYTAETELASAIARLASGMPEKYDPGQIEGFKTLDPSQQIAVIASLSAPFSIITGGPGTGKTTIIKKITATWKKRHPAGDIILLAPTGKAARRMEESCGLEASTIHSKLRLGATGDEGEGFEESGNTITNSLVIVDETSMLDLWLARTLLKSLEDCKVVFVGDIHQLPSVGVGAVLCDIIRSKSVPVSVLKYTHRQDDGSTITDNADRIRNGDPNLVAADDFDIIKFCRDSVEAIREQAEAVMVDAYIKEVDRYGKDNVICLCPFKKYTAGTRSLNKAIQDRVNPKKPGMIELFGRNGDVFRRGDPVIQLKNTCDDNGERLSNGDIGRVESITLDENGNAEMAVAFDSGKVMEYTKSDTEDITLAYAITVHKSQGSEYDSVITCILDSHSIMLYRKLIYTAITRGAKKVTLITQDSALQSAITNTSERPRKTGLKDAIVAATTAAKAAAEKDA